jgi:hypothetical protein
MVPTNENAMDSEFRRATSNPRHVSQSRQAFVSLSVGQERTSRRKSSSIGSIIILCMAAARSQIARKVNFAIQLLREAAELMEASPQNVRGSRYRRRQERDE